jgi:hypothetical protein
MKKILLLGALVCTAAHSALADDEIPSRSLRRDAAPSIGTPALTSATPEMWFYEQERVRQESPKYLIRRKAELRAAQRQQRLAALKWYGMSNSRPTANPTPLFSTYSPTWVAPGYDPLRWHAGAPTIYIADRSRGEY